MRSVAPMKIAKIGYIIISLVLCTLGIMLIADPDISINTIGLACGIILIIFGGVKLVGYFSRDLFRLAFQYDLIFGVLIIALGTIILVNPGSMMNFLCIALGLSILADGLLKIRISIDSKRFGIREWWLILALAIPACLLGGVLMFRPGQGAEILCILLGATLLVEGILNISTVVTAVKIINHQQPDVIEELDNERKE